jgi:tetratricopeptide (TPR) repeat protein
VLCGIAGGLLALAFIVCVSSAIKNWNDTQLPTLSTSWVVATESLKLKPFTGVGAGNYLSAFSRFIPITYNASNQWSTRFSNASNFYLTTIAETGLLGLASIVVLIIAFYKTAKKSFSDGAFFEYLPAISMLVAFALFPGTPVLIVFFFITLALSGRTHIVHMFTPPHEEASASTEGKFATFATAVPLILISIFALFLVGREVKAEVLYQKALNAVSAQDGKLAYDTLQNAINTSPYNDRMHLTYSQLNLLLANALTQKKTLSEEEKNTISQLVQQAVREGRAAVALNVDRSGNWVNLGSIYRAVIPLAKGADQFALQTYSQAIVLDPINPNIRVALGGVYYGLKRYEEAIDVFRLATSAKPDFANAHYNLAIAYRDNGQYDKALSELTGVLSLVQKDSVDYQAVQKEIENVKSKAPQKAPAPVQTDNLTPPTKIEEDKKLQEKIALPNEATPAAVVSPTPEASPEQ